MLYDGGANTAPSGARGSGWKAKGKMAVKGGFVRTVLWGHACGDGCLANTGWLTEKAKFATAFVGETVGGVVLGRLLK